MRPALTLLMGAVGLVLLIGCANLANLLLVRADARAREMEVRLALGAGRGRLIRQSLVESALVSLAGAGFGLLVATWGLDAIVAMSPVDLSAFGHLSIDRRGLAFALGLSLGCSVLFGLAPAWRSAQVSLAGASRGRVTSETPASRRTRDLLVVGQSAVALMLLIGALLVLRSVATLLDVSPGFDPSRVITVRFWMPQPNDPATGPYFRHEQRLPFYRRLIQQVKSLPGVEDAGFTTALPLVDRRSLQGVLIEGRPVESTDTVTAQQTLASPGYFGAMHIAVVRGRVFADSDDERAPGVALINESFARKFFGNEDPVGRRIRPGGRQSTAPWLTIVGVVGDVRSDGLDRDAPPQLYRAMLQASSLQFALVVRGTIAPASIGPAIAREVRSIDADMPVYGVRPFEEIVEDSIGQRRLAMQLLGVFAGAAVLLAAIGLYGVMSYYVGLRQRELGVRLAVGATPRQLSRLVLTRGVVLTVIGIGIGLAAASGLSTLLRTLLYQLTPLDATTYAESAAVLALVALVACWIPARRAAAIDPVRTLRAD
jgi:predicted permease